MQASFPLGTFAYMIAQIMAAGISFLSYYKPLKIMTFRHKNAQGRGRYPQKIGIFPEGVAELPRPAPALLAEAHLPGKLRARRRVIGRHHRVVRRQTPFLAVLLRRHVVLRAQVTLERLEFLAVLETDDVLGRHRLLHRHRRLQRLAGAVAAFASDAVERSMHLVDE